MTSKSKKTTKGKETKKIKETNEIKQGKETNKKEQIVKNVVEEVKVKKKRGRKPKPKTEEDLKPKVKKKRGRKPKPKTAEDLKPKVKKKRGRKPKHKIYTVNNKKMQPTNIDNNNIIIHIPLKMNEFKNNKNLFENQKNIFKYNPNLSIPLDYEPKKINNTPIDNICNFNSNNELQNEPLSTQYSNYPETFKKSKLLSKDITHFDINDKQIPEKEFSFENTKNDMSSNEESELNTTNKNNKNKKFVNYNEIIEDIHLTQKKYKNEYKPLSKKSYNINTIFGKKNLTSWPKSTQIHCFWDCHPFNNIPISIPLKVENGVYHVYGCFCSLECAAAYIFKNYTMVKDIIFN